MKTVVSIGLAFIALICALRSAYLWGRSTQVRPEPTGFEPVIPELKRGWWQLAESEAAVRAGQFNWDAARWAAVTAVFGFASAAVSLWPI
jgi:hypothetical protein